MLFLVSVVYWHVARWIGRLFLAREELALLQKQNTFLSNRIELMRQGQIDSDILAETARAELGLYASDDVIITIDIKDLKF